MKTTANKTMTASQIATAAHEHAAKYAVRWGIPRNVIEQAAISADMLELEGDARQLWIERCAGHWMNLEATGQGV
jgi:hypothetical protein